MQIIFLTCLSLLFSTQVYAGEWFVDGDSDCKIWSPDPIGEKETITYTAKCVDGKAHGKGSLTVYDNGKKSSYYEGEFENGKWQRGKGSLTKYQNGSKVSYHKGELRNGEFPGDHNSGKDDNKLSDSNWTSSPFQQTM